MRQGGMKERLRSMLTSPSGQAVIISLAVFILYLQTVCPTVAHIDNGELGAVAALLGTAHPTGYPLLTLLGRFFLLFPLGFEEIRTLNILASLFTASAAGLFYALLLAVRSSSYFIRRTKNNDVGGDATFRISAAVGTLTLAAASTFWSQSTSFEAYPLHLTLLMLAMLFFVKGVGDSLADSSKISRNLLIFSFVLGLSFANHMTTILLAPALLYVFLNVFGLNRRAIRTVLMLAPFFLLGLSLYIYLPVRAASQPPLLWGYPAELERFVWHITGKQFRVWMFSGSEVMQKQLTRFFDSFFSEFTLPATVVIMMGVIEIFRSSKRLLIWVLLLFGFCLLYSVNYDIHDINSYFLLAHVAAAMACVFGIEFLMRLIAKWDTFPRMAVSVLILAGIPLYQVYSHYDSVDQSDNYLVEDYTRSILENVEPNSVILSYQWDNFVSASLYYRYVRGLRSDVTVIDKELLRRSWYYVQLERTDRWLMERVRWEKEAFLHELYKFEHEAAYDGNIIEARFNAMINRMIDTSLSDRAVYVGFEIEPQFAPRHQRVADGLMYRLVPVGKIVALQDHKYYIRNSKRRDEYAGQVRIAFARMLTLNALFRRNQGNFEQALYHLDLALRADPQFKPALALREEVITLQQRNINP